MTDVDQQPAPPGTPQRVIAGRYELLEEVARGGMGAVWLARDQKLDRQVALKILLLTESPDALERFEREAKTVASLKSDHVVQVHDYGVEKGVPFIVMELLEGESLGDRLKREGKLPMHETVLLLVQIARGLRAAHAAGLVHRDLKPSNIFLAKRADGVVVKLLDFGVVKAADHKDKKESTASGVVLGTPQYMSPEQARGVRQVDQRADLWSLGVILLRCVTGTNPFSSESVGDAVIKICIEPIPKASDIVRVPEELDLFFARALSRDPELRFQSAEELAECFFAAVGLGGDLDASVEGSGRLGVLDARVKTVSSLSIEIPPESKRGDDRPSRSGALATTPASGTVAGTLVTSVSIPLKRRPRALLAAAGAAAVLVGGLSAYALLRPSSGAVANASSPATSAPSVATTPPEPSAQTTSSAAAATAASAASSTSTEGAAASSSASGSAPGSATSTRSGTRGSSPGGVWVPSDQGQNKPKDAPKWY